MWKGIFIVIILGIAIYQLNDLPTVNQADDDEINDTEREILPDDILPTFYQIQIEPHWENFTFTGTTLINLSIQTPTKEITFHTYQLEITEVSLHFESSIIPIVLFPSEIEYNSELKRTTLLFTEFIEGKALLNIEYTGIINDQMSGFYRSQYLEKTTPPPQQPTPKYLLTTQMEPTDARRVFPCWDEPGIKAKFQISLIIPNQITALSNMPILNTKEHTKEKKLVLFEKSPIMSTYLVAFALGEFNYVEDHLESTKIRVYTTMGKQDQGNFALEIAKQSLQFYNDYFGISYPLPKLDLIAIPDFAAGAMENWGLITFRENLLLVDKLTSGIASRQKVAYVIAHEIAHQVSKPFFTFFIFYLIKKQNVNKKK